MLRVAPLDVAGLLHDALWTRRTAVLTSATLPARLPEPPRRAPGRGHRARCRQPVRLRGPGRPLLRGPPPRSAQRRLPRRAGRRAGRPHRGRRRPHPRAVHELPGARRDGRPRLQRPRRRADPHAARRCPRPGSLEEFAADAATCLFATMGFWQGVDVPGAVAAASWSSTASRSPARTSRSCRPGGSGPAPTPSAASTCPRAATLLAQGAGRLIRTATDRGRRRRARPPPGHGRLPLGHRAGPPADAPHQGPRGGPRAALRAIRDAAERARGRPSGMAAATHPLPPVARARSASGPSSSSPDAGRRCCSAAVTRRVRRHRGRRRRRRLVPRLRAGHRRGVDGRRAGRLVRGGRALPPPARPADPPHGDHPRAQGAVRRDARRVHPVELPHPRRGGRAGAGAPTSAGGWPAGWPTRPTPSGWPATWPTARCRWPTCCGTRTCRPRSTAPCAAGSRPRRSRRWPGGPSAALTRDGRHDELVDAALPGLAGYLDEHRDELHRRFERLVAVVAARARSRTASSSGCSTGPARVLDEMVRDRDHDLRRLLDERIAQLAHDLQTSPELRARGDQLARDLLDQPELRALGRRPVGRGQGRPAGPGQPTPTRSCAASWPGAIAAGGQRLLDEPALAAKVAGRRRAGRPLRGGALRRRDHRPRERPPSPAGTARRPPSASSSSSAPTCSSSASTAPSSAASPASSSTPSPRPSAEPNGR